MNDPISDMLTRIRNASRALLPAVEVPQSKMKEGIAGILKREGYIADFAVDSVDHEAILVTPVAAKARDLHMNRMRKLRPGKH